MEQLTIRVREDTLEAIEAEAEERDTSKSEVAREYLGHGADYVDLQTECDRLRNRVQTLIAMHDEHDELVRYVEENRSLQRQKHEAGAVERLKWLVFGGE